MDIEKRLKEVILSQYKSCREFCLAHNIPPSTLASVLNHSIGRASIDVVMNICNALNLDVNALCKGKIEYKTSYPIEDLVPNVKLGSNFIVSIGRGGKRSVYEISDDDAQLVDAFLKKLKKD